MLLEIRYTSKALILSSLVWFNRNKSSSKSRLVFSRWALTSFSVKNEVTSNNQMTFFRFVVESNCRWKASILPVLFHESTRNRQINVSLLFKKNPVLLWCTIFTSQSLKFTSEHGPVVYSSKTIKHEKITLTAYSIASNGKPDLVGGYWYKH